MWQAMRSRMTAAALSEPNKTNPLPVPPASSDTQFVATEPAPKSPMKAPVIPLPTPARSNAQLPAPHVPDDEMDEETFRCVAWLPGFFNRERERERDIYICIYIYRPYNTGFAGFSRTYVYVCIYIYVHL